MLPYSFWVTLGGGAVFSLSVTASRIFCATILGSDVLCFAGVTTLGGDTCWLIVGVIVNLGPLADIGGIVPLFNICASWMYVFVIFEPYCNVGMLFLGSCKIANRSVAVCLR